ncbi:MAG: RidA family protein [Candidatus Binatia bacterium]
MNRAGSLTACKARPSYHFAPAVIDGDHLRCSGMIGLNPDFTVPEDPEEQFTLAFQHLRGLLDEAGVTLADATEMTTYHIGLQAHMHTFAAVKDRFMSAPHVAWTAVGVSELAVPGALVEIALTARMVPPT